MNGRLLEVLEERLTRPLPGPMVGSRFEPLPPRARYDLSPPGARQAAVLILFYPYEDRWHLPLILRPSGLADHAGQIGLPGGAAEPGETGRETAIREFHEELGAAGHRIEVLGRLSPIFVAVSNFRVEPWVAATSSRPALAPNPAEVKELLEVPLAHLMDPANFGVCRLSGKDRSCTAPHFLWDGHRVWGATCMILGELVTILEECEPWDWLRVCGTS